MSIVRSRGEIQARLSYDQRTTGPSGLRAMTLVVRRAGGVVIDDRRYPVGDGYQVNGVTLQNVWGSSDPEVLVDIETGGNGCCDRLGLALVDTSGAGRVLSHDFGMGWHAGAHGGAFEFVSADDRFYCTFSDCASSSQPVQIFALDNAGRKFVDVTRTRPDLITADAAEQWAGYTKELGRHNPYERLGVLGPWCADEYLLRRVDQCKQVLTQALAKGLLNGYQGGRAGVDLLLKDLAAWGYDR